MVGTSLIVIIPEGVETVYAAAAVSPIAHSHTKRGVSSFAIDQLQPETTSIQQSHHAQRHEKHVGGADAFHAMPGPAVPENIPDKPTSKFSPQPHTNDKAHNLAQEHSTASKSASTVSSKHQSPHAYVGTSLVLGFILMYLIDKIPQHASGTSHIHRQPYHISLEHLSQGLTRTDGVIGRSSQHDDDGGGEVMESPSSPTPSASRKTSTVSTTAGLVIHAAADGIALGASSSTANSNLGFMVFLAIMVHKAPAAFGLTSVLLKHGLSKRRARAHLVIFSLAAPVGALTTWLLVNVAGRSRLGGDEETQWWTGILLLFSAGTFLYVCSTLLLLSFQFSPINSRPFISLRIASHLCSSPPPHP